MLNALVTTPNRTPNVPDWQPKTTAEAIRADRAELALLNLVAERQTDTVLHGTREGTRFLTSDFVIIEEEEVCSPGEAPEVRRSLNEQKHAVRAQEAWMRQLAEQASGEDVAVFAGYTAQGEPLADPVPKDIYLRQLSVNTAASLQSLEAQGQALRRSRLVFPVGEVFERMPDWADCRKCPNVLAALNCGGQCCAGGCPGFRNLCRIAQPYGPQRVSLSWLFAQQEGVGMKDAVDRLAERFDIDQEDAFEPMPAAGAWHQVRNLPELPPDFNGVVFRNRVGQPLGAVLHPLEGESLAGMPVTAWRCGASQFLRFFHVPWQQQVPLLNQDLMADRPNVPVVICGNLADAWRRSQEGDDAVYSAWLGGCEVIDAVDFSVLRGHDITVEIGDAETGQCSDGEAREIVRNTLRVCEKVKRATDETIRLTSRLPGLLQPSHDDTTDGHAVFESVTLQRFLEIAASRFGLPAQVNRIRAFSNPRIEVTADDGHCRLPEPEFVIAPIFEEGAITMFYGPKGVGKTSLAMNWAYAAALGGSFAGVFNAPKPVGVLYLEGESGETGLHRRVNHSREHFGLKQDEPTLLYHQSVSLDLYSESERAWVDRQIREIHKGAAPGERIRLLVIDNLTSMCGAKDYASGWDGFFTWASKLRDEGIHVLVVGHTSKSGDLLGSGMKANNADNLIRVERYHDPATGDEEGRVRQKTAKEIKRETEDRDPDLLQTRLTFQKLRNNPYPEAGRTVNLEHRIRRNTWQVIGGTDKFIERILRQQVNAGRTDREMAVYWGIRGRTLRSRRENFGLSKTPARGRRKADGDASPGTTHNRPETDNPPASLDT